MRVRYKSRNTENNKQKFYCTLFFIKTKDEGGWWERTRWIGNGFREGSRRVSCEGVHNFSIGLTMDNSFHWLFYFFVLFRSAAIDRPIGGKSTWTFRIQNYLSQSDRQTYNLFPFVSALDRQSSVLCVDQIK